MTRLCAYAITKAALQDLTGSSQVPSHWFDWEANTMKVAGIPLRRFSVIECAVHDQHGSWVEAIRDFGLTPFLLVSMEERAQAVQWMTGASSFIPVEVHCIDREDQEESSAIADELSMPDQPVLDQWTLVCLGGVSEPSPLKVPQALVMPYADALSAWAVSPRTQQILLSRGEPDYTRWPEVRDLTPEDFVSWPAALQPRDDGLQLFVPLRAFPVSGVGVRDGRPTAFGLLCAEGHHFHWPFGNDLQYGLMKLIHPGRFSLKFNLTELLARFDNEHTQILRTGQEPSFALNLGRDASSQGSDAGVSALWNDVELTFTRHRRHDDRHLLKLHGASPARQVRVVFRDPVTMEVILDQTIQGGAPGVTVELKPDVDLSALQLELELR